MPKVILPLGSSEAHGKIGNLAVFQGTYARAWKAPRNPNSAEQIAVRDKFHDVTKLLKCMGAFGREVCRKYWGVRWFQKAYGAVQADADGYWAAALTHWSTLSGAEKDGYRAQTPFAYTKGDKGEMFFALADFLYSTFVGAGFGAWGLPIWSNKYYVLTHNWWAWGLDHALGAGTTDDDSALITFVNKQLGTNASCYNGTYKAFSTYCEWFFYGEVCSFYYFKGVNGGDRTWQLDYGEQGTYNTYNTTPVYGQFITLPTVELGLHHVKITKVTGVAGNLDRVDVQ